MWDKSLAINPDQPKIEAAKQQWTAKRIVPEVSGTRRAGLASSPSCHSRQSPLVRVDVQSDDNEQMPDDSKSSAATTTSSPSSSPPALATIPGRGETDSVLEQLGRQLEPARRRGEADPRVRVVHRLDKDTSGVLLFALNRAAQQHVSHQFQNNTVEKEYLALVRGRPAREGRRRRRAARAAPDVAQAHGRRQARRAAGADRLAARGIVPRLQRCSAASRRPARRTRSASTSRTSACRWRSTRSTTRRASRIVS